MMDDADDDDDDDNDHDDAGYMYIRQNKQEGAFPAQKDSQQRLRGVPCPQAGAPWLAT